MLDINAVRCYGNLWFQVFRVLFGILPLFIMVKDINSDIYQYFHSIPYFTDYKMLRTIWHTLIFKQFKKNNIFYYFYYQIAKPDKKKFLVYKTELTFKISENHHFFQLFFTSTPIANGFFPLVEGQNAAQLLCFHVLLYMLLLSIYSLHHMNTFYFFPLRNYLLTKILYCYR